jgi:phosphoribosylformylglycinamidine (FGAM) synthase PurS component
VLGVNDDEPNEVLSAQKALARETVKAVADVFALKVMLASTGRTEDELETELGRLRETVLYKTVVEVGEFRIDRAEHDQQLFDLLVRMRNAA